MSARHQCERCGRPLSDAVSETICPACLLQLGHATWLGESTIQTSGAFRGDNRGAAESDVTPHPAAPQNPPSGDRVLIGEHSHPGPETVESLRGKRCWTGLPVERQDFGDYRIVRVLGEGGMGVVYEADHLPTERRVALKVLTHRLDSIEARQRFLREGQIAASISHPNSIYIFGTEEIEGVPVISMELAPGGTLKDRVSERGPFSVREAVDAILGVIAGLEAAQAKGILHRDIKPANCFIDTDGRIQIGDFGLSISTLDHPGADLTRSGTFLGTPAFASPEQVRGQALDCRADIYSVGATLYYLLTSKTPFAGKDLDQVLAAVLDQEPESPRRLRPDIPKGLSKVLRRCMAKQREKRFLNYNELRLALVGYGSRAASPATLGLRTLAGFIDHSLLAVLGLGFVTLSALGWDKLSDRALPQLQGASALSVLWGFATIAYFTVTEGHWGRSMGKHLCHLQVIRVDGGSPGLALALLRALLFLGVVYLTEWLPIMAGLWSPATLGSEIWARLADNGWFQILLMLVLFVGARTGNRFAAIHDRLTRTRVVESQTLAFQSLGQPMPEGIAAAEPKRRIGPYLILEELGRNTYEQWYLGYDAPLLRKVWIRKVSSSILPSDRRRRAVNRAGRVRWLNGQCAEGEAWDAFEAVSGWPFLKAVAQPQPWLVVRRWLLDLAEELHASVKDQTLPSRIGLNHIWITAEGRAKLLDFPPPGWVDQPTHVTRTAVALNEAELSEGDSDLASPFGIQSFLKQVALWALEGRFISLPDAGGPEIGVPLPQRARQWLEGLPGSHDLGIVIGDLTRLMPHRPAISRSLRLGMLAVCALPILILIGGHFALAFEQHERTQALEQELIRDHPEFIQLVLLLLELQNLEGDSPEAGDVEKRVAIESHIMSLFVRIGYQADLRLKATASQPPPPAGGKPLVIVSQADDGSLRFELFDVFGELMVDKTEAELPERRSELDALRSQLGGMWNQPELRPSQQQTIVRTVESILGLSPDLWRGTRFSSNPNNFRSGSWPLTSKLDLGFGSTEPIRLRLWPSLDETLKTLDGRRWDGRWSPAIVEMLQSRSDSEITLPREHLSATIASMPGGPQIPVYVVPQDFRSAFEFGLISLTFWAAVFNFLLLLLVLITNFSFRRGLLLWVLDWHVVTRRGAPASRVRILVRTLLAWSPVILLGAMQQFWLKEWIWTEPVGGTEVACSIGLVFLSVTGAVYAWRHPARSLQDRLAGTCLVPP